MKILIQSLLDSNNIESVIPEALSEEIPLEIPVQE